VRKNPKFESLYDFGIENREKERVLQGFEVKWV
jgi:hypothetical protein